MHAAEALGEGCGMMHTMADIESCGTRPGSVILSIGAVGFDYAKSELGPEFYIVINRASSVAAGLTEDAETLDWWGRQSPEARQVFTEAETSPHTLKDALQQFTAYLRQFGPQVRVWGCGSSFDGVLIAAAYNAVGQRQPWRYVNDRCYRTLKNLVPGVEMKRTGTHHHALADAKAQAVHAMLMLQEIASINK